LTIPGVCGGPCVLLKLELLAPTNVTAELDRPAARRNARSESHGAVRAVARDTAEEVELHVDFHSDTSQK
jgi:hypothetical protein